MKKLGSRGFSHVEALIVAVAIVLVGVVGFYVFNKVQDRSSRAESENGITTEVVAPETDSIPADQKQAIAAGFEKAVNEETKREAAGEVVPERNNCANGRGTSGSRVEIIYLTRSSNDNYTADAETIRQSAMGVDTIFNNSAAKTGGKRKVRWARNDQCKIAVRKVVSNNAQLWRSVDADVNNNPQSYDHWPIPTVANAGFDKADRKYIVFVNNPGNEQSCGVDIRARNDDRATENNRNNNKSYQVVYESCWNRQQDSASPAWHGVASNSRYLAGALAKAMGAPQSSAPNARFFKPPSGPRGFTGSLNDAYGILSVGPEVNNIPIPGGGSYNPASQKCVLGADGQNFITEATASRSNYYLLDCNDDDYFNTNPARGSYLKTHWNIANSKYLYTPAN